MFHNRFGRRVRDMYQGPTSVGPLRTYNIPGFSPCAVQPTSFRITSLDTLRESVRRVVRSSYVSCDSPALATRALLVLSLQLRSVAAMPVLPPANSGCGRGRARFSFRLELRTRRCGFSYVEETRHRQ